MPEDTPAPALPDFTPVPRLKDRSNGWKPHVQRAFVEALAETGSVRAACRRVGRSEHGAYQLRRHPEGASLRAAWDAALEFGVRRIEDAAMDRALYGVEEEVYYHGELKTVRRRHNERLVMFMLRNRAPHRFAEGKSKGLSALDKATLRKLEKQWREQWERERWAREAEEERETKESIDRFLETMARNRKANMSPAQRAHEIAAHAQARADAAAGWRPGAAYREFVEDAARLLPRFIAEVEAEWPPLEAWAWDDPASEADEHEDGDEACPEPGRAEPRALPPPRDAQQPPPGPRVRTLKDDKG